MIFDPKFALEVLLPLADAAYATPIKVGIMPISYVYAATVTVDSSMVEWQMSNIKPSRRESLRSILNSRRFGCIYYSELATTLVIAFRGTYDIADIIRDFEFDSEDYKCVPEYGQVHVGFQHIYFAVRDSVLESIKQLTNAGKVITRCILTGHSMGGALSVLSAPDIFYQHLLPQPPEVITFASPRAGHADFVEKFNHDIVDCLQVVNKWDFVTRIPPLFNGYSHVGQVVGIDGGRTLDSYRAHSLEESYITGVRILLDKLAGK